MIIGGLLLILLIIAGVAAAYIYLKKKEGDAEGVAFEDADDEDGYKEVDALTMGTENL